MSEEPDPMENIPTSPSLRKTTRESNKSEFQGFDSLNSQGRIRASSWDESDEDLSTHIQNANSKTGRIYSKDDEKLRGPVFFDINELKKKFFETIEREKENEESLESLKDKFCYDRRQSPARIRRRTKSSEGSSPVRESKNQTATENSAKYTEREPPLESPSKVLECDPEFYLNSFFSELRSRRISMIDPVSAIDGLGQISNYDRGSLELYNELCSVDPNDDDGFLCINQRKLSQILEVEENKKDLEKFDEENAASEDFCGKKSYKPEENCLSSPQTTRRKKRNKSPEQTRKTGNKKEKFKSLSSEYFECPKKNGKSRGSLSERPAKFFDGNLESEIISLTGKFGKTQLSSPKFHRVKNNSIETENSPEEKNSETPVEYFCLASTVGTNKNFSNLEKKSDLHESAATEKSSKSDNPDSRKTGEEDEVDEIHSNRTPSGKSTKSSKRETPKTRRSSNSESPKSRSSNPKSPKFSINLEGLKVEDVSSPDSNRSGKNHSRNCSFSNRSNNWSEQNQKTERLENPHSRFQSTKEKNMTNRSRSSCQASDRLKVNKNPEEHLQTGNNSSRQKEQKVSDRSTKGTTGEKIGRTSRSSRKSSTDSPKTTENRYIDYFSGDETPGGHEIPELSLPLDICEREESQKTSRPSAKTIEIDDVIKDSDRSETSSSKDRTRSSRSRNPGSRMSTPHRSTLTPRSNGGSSRKSKGSSGNRDATGNLENLRGSSWKEFEKFCDTLGRGTSTTPGRSSWREVANPQHFHLSETCKPESDDSGIGKTKEGENRKGTRSDSGMISRRPSVEPNDIPEQLNLSPARSEKTKTSPTWTSDQHLPAIHIDIEKLNAEATSERTNKSSIFEEDEDAEECTSTQRSRNRQNDSERPSGRRLSVINETSFEDLETSNTFNSNEVKDTWDRSRPASKRLNNRSPKSNSSVEKPSHDSPKTSGRSLKEETGKAERQTWSELIEMFQGSPGSSSIMEKNFPGFPNLKEISWNSIGGFERNLLTTAEDNKLRGKNVFFEKQTAEDLNNFKLDYNEPLEEKISSPVQTSHKLYYFNVDRKGPYGIGEFGDVTCWTSGEPDLGNPEKPKGHGDGIPMQKTSQVFDVKQEKKEKDIQTQRQLWTESRDFRDSRPFSSKLFSEVQYVMDFINFPPPSVKTSKSDNFIDRKSSRGSDSPPPTGSLLLKERKDTLEITDDRLLESNRNKRGKREIKSTSKNSSFASLESGKEDLENWELDCEITPRLSRYLSDLDIRLQDDAFNREPNAGLDTSENQTLRKSTDYFQMKEEKEESKLTIFLAPREKEEKFSVKSNNWLTLKNSKEKDSLERGKKAKTKSSKKSMASNNEYLSFRKGRSSTSGLKLRSSNCFQNFYRRFIGVFCLTSNSSAATSK